MGCINCINTKDKKYTTIVYNNQLMLETNEKNQSRNSLNDLYGKRLFEEKKQSIVTQNIEDLIENNPLPFVKIKRKSKL